MAVGGGLDIAVSEKIAIRLVDADFDLTRFGNNSRTATTARAISGSRLACNSGFNPFARPV
jgi:hypothetical protein